jgi:hypothetical protein
MRSKVENWLRGARKFRCSCKWKMRGNLFEGRPHGVQGLDYRPSTSTMMQAVEADLGVDL